MIELKVEEEKNKQKDEQQWIEIFGYSRANFENPRMFFETSDWRSFMEAANIHNK